jgi:uncharacterized membrane protein YkvA (DUF1232 family)
LRETVRVRSLGVRCIVGAYPETLWRRRIHLGKEREADEAPPFQGTYCGVPIIASLKLWARAIKRDVVALWLAARDPRVPWYAKVAAGAVAAYALSPIDLIPDFIPVFGYLDDLIIVPLGILLAVRLVPVELMAEFRAEAARRSVPSSRAGLAFIAAIWIVVLAALVWFFWPARA